MNPAKVGSCGVNGLLFKGTKRTTIRSIKCFRTIIFEKTKL